MPPDQLTMPLGKRSKTGRIPCPFCGSVDLSLIVYGEQEKPLLIQCNNCGATGPTPKDPTEAQLSALWDMRSKEL